MTVYLDIFFFSEFVMDFFVITLAGRLGGVRFSLVKTLISALTGAVFSCVAIFLPFGGGLLLNLLSLSIMSIIAFGFLSAVIFIKQTLLLFCGFFILGGVFGASFSYGWGKFFGLTLIAFLYLIWGKIRSAKGVNYAKIYVKKDNKEYVLTALFDSGNLCTDFLTGLPVIMAENVFENVDCRKGFFNTASGTGEVNLFLPDEIKVEFNGETYKGKDVSIGVTEGKLADEGNFNALIGGICFERLVRENNKVHTKTFLGK